MQADRIFDIVTDTAFHTPVVRLQRLIPREKAEVLVKLEYFNPMGSVKDRIGIAMIDAAERDGRIQRGRTHIVEPTSGNTGLALAFVAAARGYKLTLTMPETMSVERRVLLQSLGAELILAPHETGMGEAIARAIDIVQGEKDAWMPMQFENPANPAIHEQTTGPEIWAACEGKIDAIVAGVGTGGTITGVTRFIRKHNPNFLAIAVEPTGSSVILGDKPGHHEIQGIGAGFVPATLDTSLLSGIVTVSNEEAYEWTARLPKAEGILGGISTGANVCAVDKAIDQYNLHGKRIITIACDFGERYVSTKVFDPTAVFGR